MKQPRQGGHADARQSKSRRDAPLPVIGWREWLELPELGIAQIKAKVDTGARSSSLHALDLEDFRRDQAPWVRFVVHPDQRSTEHRVVVEAELLEHRLVRSSDGTSSRRPVILTPVHMAGAIWTIELTLADRIDMGFRMLLGREALRGRFLVDPDQSYCTGAANSPPDPKHP